MKPNFYMGSKRHWSTGLRCGGFSINMHIFLNWCAWKTGVILILNWHLCKTRTSI